MRVFAGLICAVAVGLQPLCAAADERSDAAAIAELILSDEAVEATFGAVGALMADVIIAEFRRTGVDISDEASALLGEILLTKMIEEMGPPLRDIHRDIYRENLSAKELQDYLAFLRSPAGQAAANLQPVLITEGAKRGETLGQEAAPRLFGDVIADLQAGRLPEGTNRKVSDELIQLLTAK